MRHEVKYDSENVFAKILRKEILSETIYEDAYVLAFHDTAPARPVHALVIPKGPYRSLAEMARDGADAEICALFRALDKVAELCGVGDNGYRVVSNVGSDSGQEVPHLHFHILGGGPVGPMVARR